jgi:hypothetical protein
VRLEASTKPHIHQKIEILWTNIAFIMGCQTPKTDQKRAFVL